MARALPALFCIMLVLSIADAEQPRTLHDYMRMPEYVGTGSINPALPLRALAQEDVNRWSQLLIASDAQRRFIDLEYSRFVERHNSFMDRVIPEYLATSAEVESASHSFDQDLVDAMKSLRKRSEELCRKLERLEHEFIDSIVPVLTTEQIARLDILRHEARRRNARTVRNTVRWADVELRRVWEAVDVDHIAPEQLKTIDAILLEYERSLTPLVRAQAEAFWNRPIAIIALLNRHRTGQISDDSFNRQYRRAYRRQLDVGLRIRQLTKATLERIREAVHAEVFEALVSNAKASVYPEIYPDTADLSPLFDALMADTELSGDSHASLSLQFDTYREHHSRLSRDMERLCLEWSDGSARGDSDYHPAYLPDELAPLLERREQLTRETLELLQELLNTEALDRHRHLIPFE